MHGWGLLVVLWINFLANLSDWYRCTVEGGSHMHHTHVECHFSRKIHGVSLQICRSQGRFQRIDSNLQQKKKRKKSKNEMNNTHWINMKQISLCECGGVHSQCKQMWLCVFCFGALVFTELCLHHSLTWLIVFSGKNLLGPIPAVIW